MSFNSIFHCLVYMHAQPTTWLVIMPSSPLDYYYKSVDYETPKKAACWSWGTQSSNFSKLWSMRDCFIRVIQTRLLFYIRVSQSFSCFEHNYWPNPVQSIFAMYNRQIYFRQPFSQNFTYLSREFLLFAFASYFSRTYAGKISTALQTSSSQAIWYTYGAFMHVVLNSRLIELLLGYK